MTQYGLSEKIITFAHGVFCWLTQNSIKKGRLLLLVTPFILKFISDASDSEVKRVLKLSPNWEPGTKNGVPIDTMVNQRVYFSRQKQNPQVTENDICIITWSEKINLSEFNLTMEKLNLEAAKRDLANRLNEEGSTLMKLKKFDEALVKFNEAIKQGGNLNSILYNRGLAYLNLKQDDKAKADFLEAYRQGDEDAGKIYNDLFK